MKPVVKKSEIHINIIYRITTLNNILERKNSGSNNEWTSGSQNVLARKKVVPKMKWYHRKYYKSKTFLPEGGKKLVLSTK